MKHPPQVDPDESADPDGDVTVPTELDEEPTGKVRPARAHGPSGVKVAFYVAGLVLVLAALLGYRSYHQHRVVAEGIRRAEALLRLDTAAGYREAANILQPLAEMDHIEAASVRAFALASLFADYRDTAAEDAAESLLVEPGRAAEVPLYANLAYAALALGRHEAGNATTAASRAGDSPYAQAIQARIALLAGYPDVALEPAAAAAAAGLPAGLAIQGDLLRRSGKDFATARSDYEAALSASPRHARASFGLAKLALAGHADSKSARAALERLLDGDAFTFPAERGRAALHLAALLIRSGESSAAGVFYDKAQLSGPIRAWAERAAVTEARSQGPYHAVSDAPPPLQSVSDDDPAEIPPYSPPPPSPPPAPAPSRSVEAERPTHRAKVVSKHAKAKPAKKKAKAVRERKAIR